LSNAVAYVQTDSIQQGALAPNGLPIAWLLTYFGTTNVNANADPTGKGMTIAQDYLAGTNPTILTAFFESPTESFSSGGTSAMQSPGTVCHALLLHSENAEPEFSPFGWTAAWDLFRHPPVPPRRQ
jgi:hypothetical protein